MPISAVVRSLLRTIDEILLNSHATLGRKAQPGRPEWKPGLMATLAKASRAMAKGERWRPEVERLDSRTLLSGVAALVSLHISGTLKGMASTRGSPTFHSRGALDPLGNVTAAG